ncbi:MAG: RNA-dependent RNA polymerase [Koper totivirus 2]|nr:MAG: RNA-dependent RNA polymerase [Koper totivirus 2]
MKAGDHHPTGGRKVVKEDLTLNNIPVWCNIRGSNLTSSTRAKATYVLGHIKTRGLSDMRGVFSVRVNRQNVLAYTVPVEDLTLCYVKVSADVSGLPPYVRRTMSAMYSMVDGYDFNDWEGTRYLRRQFAVDRKIITRAKKPVPPVEGEFDRAKVTAEHHTHFRPEEVWEQLTQHKAARNAAGIILDRLRQITGVTEAVVSTILLYCLYARPQVSYLLACSTEFHRISDIGALSDWFKKLSVPFKSMHNHKICDLSELFEMTALINRGVGTVDWDDEREHRTKPNVIDVKPEAVYMACLKVFAEGKKLGYRYRKMDLDKYLDSRWEWVPTGSVHSQHRDDGPFIKKEYRHRSKFVTLNKMPKNFIRTMFTRKPEIQAWASKKYEWAKQRAIYGVDLTSTVITNFAMFRCEDVLKHKFPIGEEAAATRVHKRLAGMLKSSESLCYDFDDFNAQHSKDSMQAVLLAYLDYFSGEMSDDQREAMHWVIASIDKVLVNNNEDGRNEKYETKGTLLSGWRLTTFINTILNYVYFKISGAMDVPGVEDSVHNGDDVLLAIRTLKSAVLIHDRMAAINARAQATKCNVFSIGEFLRVEHKIERGEGLGAQYLTRGMATLAHSRIESQAPVRVVEAVKAMVSRCEEAAQRGYLAAEKSACLLQAACKRISQIFEVPYESVMRITRGHVIVGGAVAGEEGEITHKIVEEVLYEDVSAKEAEARGEATVDELSAGMTDYARTLEKQFSPYLTFDGALRKVKSATRRQLAVTRKTWLQVTDVSRQDKYRYGRALFRTYRGLVDIPHLEKARFVGLSPISMLSNKGMQIIHNILSAVSDVEYTLAVLL